MFDITVLSWWLYARYPAGGAPRCCGLHCVLHCCMVGQCGQGDHGVCWRRWFDLWLPGTHILSALTIQFNFSFNSLLSLPCGPFEHLRVTPVDLWTASLKAIGLFRLSLALALLWTATCTANCSLHSCIRLHWLAIFCRFSLLFCCWIIHVLNYKDL